MRCPHCSRYAMNCRCPPRTSAMRNTVRALAQVMKLKGCNPVRQGSDEYRCTTCGKVWDTHEPKPDCERAQDD